MSNRYLCQAYFYIAVVHLKNNNFSGYKNSIEKCISFTELLEPEYYLAIVEYEKSLIRNKSVLN